MPLFYYYCCGKLIVYCQLLAVSNRNYDNMCNLYCWLTLLENISLVAISKHQNKLCWQVTKNVFGKYVLFCLCKVIIWILILLAPIIYIWFPNPNQINWYYLPLCFSLCVNVGTCRQEVTVSWKHVAAVIRSRKSHNHTRLWPHKLTIALTNKNPKSRLTRLTFLFNLFNFVDYM